MTELVPSIGHRQRLGALGHAVAGQDLHASLARERGLIQAQATGQFHVHLHQARGRYRCWVQSRVEALRQPRIGIFETETNGVGVES